MTALVPMELFGIGWGEFTVLLILGVIMFGPEKLPDISRKAARLVHFLRVFAQQATDSIKDELGPEYKDLKPSDLSPKNLVRKTLLADIEGDLDDIKAELDGVKSDLGSSSKMVTAAAAAPARTKSASATTKTVSATTPALPPAPPAEQLVAWDPEAT